MWLAGAAAGPALVSIPVTWAAHALWRSASTWLRRRFHRDEASRLIVGLVGEAAVLSGPDIDRLRAVLDEPATWDLVVEEDLSALIRRVCACLPQRPGRDAGAAEAIAEILVRGMLESYLAEHDFASYQRVAMRRIDRAVRGVDTSIDQALIVLNDDLAAGRLASEELERTLTRCLEAILERLHPWRPTALRFDVTSYRLRLDLTTIRGHSLQIRAATH